MHPVTTRLSRRLLCQMPALLFTAPAAFAGPAEPPADAESQLRATIEYWRRSPANRARDADRRPFETLRFFGLQPTMTVIEIAPGGGWYTEILAPYLRAQGHYEAALYVEEEATPAKTAAERADTLARFNGKFGGDEARFGKPVVGQLLPSGLVDVGTPGSADMVLTFRNIHNWIEGKHFDEALQAFFTALKPGGVLGVEEHRAPPGTPLERIIATGYVPEALVIERAKAAGFQFAAASEVNANARDDHDHPNGVWSLPPTLRGGAVDRAKFLAIGESDRMTLKFIKPAA